MYSFSWGYNYDNTSVRDKGAQKGTFTNDPPQDANPSVQGKLGGLGM